MKKNYSVNIGGQLFNIDEDAHRRLDDYFNRLRSYLGGNGDAAEMLIDVEARIAELLLPLVEGTDRVVTLKAVELVISQMGEPEEWGDNHDEPDLGVHKGGRSRRIFRDADRRILGGVASGLAAWSGLDPVLVRVLFVLFTLFYFTGLLVYAVLWLVLPEARSHSDKLEMRGEEVNVDNLRRRFQEEKQRLSELGDHLPKNEDVKRFTRDFGQGLGRMVSFGARFFLRVVGVALLLMVLGMATGLLVSLFVRDTFYMGDGLRFMNLNLFQIAEYMVPNPALRWQFYIAVVVVSVSLLGLLTYWGLKLLIQWKNSTWQIPSILALLLAGGLVMGAVFAFRYQEQTESVQWKTYKAGVSGVSASSFRLNITDRGAGERSSYSGVEVVSGKIIPVKGDFFDGHADFSIEPAVGDSLSIQMRVAARGKNMDDATSNLSEVIYFWSDADSLLTLDRRFIVPLSGGFHEQQLEVTVFMPRDGQVYLSGDDAWQIDFDSFVNGHQREGGWYRMTDDGLELVQQPDSTSNSN